MLDYKNQKCPPTWRSFASKQACGRINGGVCNSVTLSAGSFRQVCGRVRAFQWGSPDAFAPKRQTLDEPYVDGVSITYSVAGRRQHVFTYAAGVMEQFEGSNWNTGLCPCAGGTLPPLFIRSADYYCESGNSDKIWYPNQLFCDPLWDGKECRYSEESCCSSSNAIPVPPLPQLPPPQPWFCKDLRKVVQSDLEIRICGDEGTDNEDIAVESYELYVR